MAFGFAALPTRKYAYKVRTVFQPVGKRRGDKFFQENFQLVRQQLWLAHQFQCDLVRIELARREELNTLIRQISPELVAIEAKAESGEAELKALREKLAEANKHAGRKVADKPLAELIKQRKEEVAKTWKAFTALKKAVYGAQSTKDQIAIVQDKYADLVTEARAKAIESGLFWPTAATVMQRIPQQGPPPRFPKFDGSGTISLQLQRKGAKDSESVPVLDDKGQPRIRNGKPMMRKVDSIKFDEAKLFTENTMLWARRQEGTTSPKRVEVYFRVGSTPEGRKPVFVWLPISYSRPIAEGSEVKWAHINCKRVGTKFIYTLLLDLAKPYWEPKVTPMTEGTVAVALGWRKIGDDIRVAAWVGSDGRSGEVILDAEIVQKFLYPDNLQSIRDNMFNDLKKKLIDWTAEQKDLPQWWKDQVQYFPQWRSANRMERFVKGWEAGNRIPGDDAILAELKGTTEIINKKTHYTRSLKQDMHLRDWAEFQRLKMSRRRTAIYREVAMALGRVYKNVVTADIDWAELTKNNDIEEADKDVQKRYQRIASCAKLRDMLNVYMNPIKADPNGIVINCNKCNFVCEDPKAKRFVDCPNCGKFDRAVNAARNLLDRATAALQVPVAA